MHSNQDSQIIQGNKQYNLYKPRIKVVMYLAIGTHYTIDTTHIGRPGCVCVSMAMAREISTFTRTMASLSLISRSLHVLLAIIWKLSISRIILSQKADFLCISIKLTNTYFSSGWLTRSRIFLFFLFCSTSFRGSSRICGIL